MSTSPKRHIGPSHASADGTAEAQLERLNHLLMQAECPVVSKDATFSSPGQQDRRRDSRHPFLAELAAILYESESAEHRFRLVRGWSLNFSPGGLAFVLPERIEDDQILLLVDHPDYQFPNCLFTARPLRIVQTQPNEWEYGALLKPAGSNAGVGQFDRSMFELA